MVAVVDHCQRDNLATNGYRGSICRAQRPGMNTAIAKLIELTNRATVVSPAGASALAEVAGHLAGKEPRKLIVVPGRMVSVVA
jgi:hypothetical protein